MWEKGQGFTRESNLPVGESKLSLLWLFQSLETHDRAATYRPVVEPPRRPWLVRLPVTTSHSLEPLAASPFQLKADKGQVYLGMATRALGRLEIGRTTL
jgi:hypothetical protein